MNTRTVLYNGDVYSSVDPFATAIAFEHGTVTWVGSDEAASEIAAGGHLIDLREDFVSPGLVHAGLDLRRTDADPSALVRAGITAVHLVGDPSDIDAFSAAAPEGLAVTAYRLGADSGPGARGVAELAGAPLPTEPQFLLADHDEELGVLLALLEDPEVRTHAQRHGYRILLDTEVPQDAVTALASSGVPVTLDPVRREQPLAALLAAGAQLSFALDAEQPWLTLRAAVYEASDGISGRAAFNCATRFAHRALGHHDAGVLAPGAQATAARWAVHGLVVQAADARVTSWSTDPRSGTPGLPDLGDPEALPVLRTVWAQGTVLFGDGGDDGGAV